MDSVLCGSSRGLEVSGVDHIRLGEPRAGLGQLWARLDEPGRRQRVSHRSFSSEKPVLPPELVKEAACNQGLGAGLLVPVFALPSLD